MATDDRAHHCQAVDAFGGRARMTSPDACLGDRPDRRRSRCRPVGTQNDIVVNLQGDEPLMPPELLQQVATSLEQHPDAAVVDAGRAHRWPRSFPRRQLREGRHRSAGSRFVLQPRASFPGVATPRPQALPASAASPVRDGTLASTPIVSAHCAACRCCLRARWNRSSGSSSCACSSMACRSG